MSNREPIVAKKKTDLVALALRDTSEIIGEPEWFAELRDRLVLATMHDNAGPLERLALLGAPASGERPDDDSGELVNEPKSVARLRTQWEREVQPDELPPLLGLRPRSNWPQVQAWRAKFYASLIRSQ